MDSAQRYFYIECENIIVIKYVRNIINRVVCYFKNRNDKEYEFEKTIENKRKALSGAAARTGRYK